MQKKKELKKYASLTTASVLTLSLAACGTPATPAGPSISNSSTESEITLVQNSEFANQCDEWTHANDGSAQCIDEDSPYYAQHFFNGLMFATLGAMMANSAYKSANKKEENKRSSSGSAVVVPPASTNNGNNNTSNSSTNSSKDGVNLNKNGSSTTTDGKSNSSNQGKSGSQVSPSNSGGKSGFSSGGGARGGSSGGS